MDFSPPLQLPQHAPKQEIRLIDKNSSNVIDKNSSTTRRKSSAKTHRQLIECHRQKLFKFKVALIFRETLHLHFCVCRKAFPLNSGRPN
jgi:hypothetical protein